MGALLDSMSGRDATSREPRGGPVLVGRGVRLPSVACDEHAVADLAVWARAGLRDARRRFRVRVAIALAGSTIIAFRVADSRTLAIAVVTVMWAASIAGVIVVGRGSATAWAERDRRGTGGPLYAEALYRDFPERVPKSQWP